MAICPPKWLDPYKVLDEIHNSNLDKSSMSNERHKTIHVIYYWVLYSLQLLYNFW